ncbi:MAG: hypothetical protein RL754_494 [Bacteroidota bacterium]|jgi:uncharacterized membrane protein
MSGYVRSILSEAQEAELVKAIEYAELQTSGEIRIHIEKSTGEKTGEQRAKTVFGKLDMHKTAEKNGVLFYLAVEDRVLALWAGEGIYQKVPEGFWNDIVATVIAEFKQSHFSEGLIAGVRMAGEALGQYFPRRHDDENELSNEISKG